MHELSIATEIHRITKEHIARHPGARLESLRVAVGELSAIEPDLLQFAWQATTEGTTEEGAQLIVEFRPARQICTRCQTETARVPGSWERACPRCFAPLIIEGGDELDVLQLTLEEGEP